MHCIALILRSWFWKISNRPRRKKKLPITPSYWSMSAIKTSRDALGALKTRSYWQDKQPNDVMSWILPYLVDERLERRLDPEAFCPAVLYVSWCPTDTLLHKLSFWRSWLTNLRRLREGLWNRTRYWSRMYELLTIWLWEMTSPTRFDWIYL